MALTRKFLTDHGLADDANITAVMNEYHAEVEPLKDANDKAKKELKKAAEDLAEAKKPKEGEDDTAAKLAEAEKKYADEVLAHQATKDGHAAEKDATEVDGLVSALLTEAKMNPAAVPKALKLYDRKTVDRKDGKITNADKVLESFKADWKDFFMETKEDGTHPPTPPTGGAPSNAKEAALAAAQAAMGIVAPTK